MNDPQQFGQFIILLVLAILAAYAATLGILGKQSKKIPRIVISGIVATVFVHAYLIITGQGPDQFVIISVLMMLIYGILGSLLLDWLRTRFFSRAK